MADTLLYLVMARGGSKGLPGKNLRPFRGRSLVAHTIDTALRCRHRGRIVTSTDTLELATEARRAGSDVPFLRPPALATDEASSFDVIVHALDELANAGFSPEHIVLLQPTSPLRRSDDIDAALDRMFDAGAPGVVSVSLAKPAEWLYTIDDGDGHLRPLFRNGAAEVSRRQDARPSYLLNGAIYAAKVGYLREHRDFVGPNTIAYVMPHARSVDIDTEADFAVAEALDRLAQT